MGMITQPQLKGCCLGNCLVLIGWKMGITTETGQCVSLEEEKWI